MGWMDVLMRRENCFTITAPFSSAPLRSDDDNDEKPDEVGDGILLACLLDMLLLRT
jgi:hypothetical protein